MTEVLFDDFYNKDKNIPLKRGTPFVSEEARKNRRSGSGGLMQLVQCWFKDIYLTGNPEQLLFDINKPTPNTSLSFQYLPDYVPDRKIDPKLKESIECKEHDHWLGIDITESIKQYKEEIKLKNSNRLNEQQPLINSLNFLQRRLENLELANIVPSPDKKSECGGLEIDITKSIELYKKEMDEKKIRLVVSGFMTQIFTMYVWLINTINYYISLLIMSIHYYI